MRLGRLAPSLLGLLLLAGCRADDSQSTGDTSTSAASTDASVTTSTATTSTKHLCFSDTYCLTPPEGVTCAACSGDTACKKLLDDLSSSAFSAAWNSCGCADCGGGLCSDDGVELNPSGAECCFLDRGYC